MKLVLDSHVHLYQSYEIPNLWLDLEQRWLKLLAPGTTKGVLLGMLCLTERYDCNFFREMKENPSAYLPQGSECREFNEACSLLITLPKTGNSFVVVAGHQIVTRERIEILSLGVLKKIPDGSEIRTTLKEIQNEGGLAVLPWSPGKWFGNRDKCVEQLIEENASSGLAFSDSALRPKGWPFPQLLRKAQRKGFSILAGSDPLPLPGENLRVGSYLSCLEMDLDSLHPFVSFKNKVLSGSPSIKNFGRRLGPIELFQKLKQLKLASKATKLA